MEENIGKNLHNLEFGDELLDIIRKHNSWNKKLITWIIFWTKLLLCKDTVKRMKRETTHWEKIFVHHISDKVFDPKYIF